MAVLLAICKVFPHRLLENLIFAHCVVIVDPLAACGGMPSNISIIYRSLKSILRGLQFCRYQYRSIFIHLFGRYCLPNLRNHAQFQPKLNL